MSRLTTAQVINLGEYLDPDFDPTSLTNPQLLGVLGYHNVHYPTPYSKPKLVQIFNDEIKAKAGNLKKERLKKENSMASDEGIIDGHSGQPLNGGLKAPIARRASRRLSRAPVQEEDNSPVRPEASKRRRSSAQPTLGGPSRKARAAQPALAEESEPEEDELPIRKIGRSKKATEAAGVQGRRVSQTANEDSGWEDNNIFQSGAESSSPARPSPIRSKVGRKNAAPRISRKSSSAPPQMLPSPPRPPVFQESHSSPPQSTFEPQLPALERLPAPKFIHATPTQQSSPLRAVESSKVVDCPTDQPDLTQAEEFSIVKEEQNVEDDFKPAISADQTIAISQGQGVSRPFTSSRSHGSGASRILQLLYATVMLVLCGVVLNYKMESAPIGYCDRGSRTNNYLEELRGERSAVDSCNRENRTLLYLPSLSVRSNDEGANLTPCPLPPLLPLPHPDSCTPCPDHATCSQCSVVCDVGYILRAHPLLSFLPPSASPRDANLSLESPPIDLLWKVLSMGLDGLPGFGSVALSPRCVEDPKRKRNIGALGKAIESLLGQERGHRLCAGGKAINDVVMDIDGGDAKKWGVELERLRDVMKKKTPPHLLATFDDTFNEAIQQLIQWDGVIIGEDLQNHRYVAHKTPHLTWDCTLTVRSREIWAEWRMTVLGLAVAFVGLLYVRARKAQKQIENKRVAELVQIALDTLRNQELAHHTDPVTAPQPYLSSLQLRDLILQDEHSISARSRLWNQVEHVVEGNTNVRTNLEEVQGGDEMRVWRWMGTGGVKHQVQE